ncbi:MAG TPA: DUF1003 domain-containing protein [Chitinophagaceae bacterium]|nr:DUF1003 domain-containing protein [Chitinophagaceae bacterium]
MEKERLEQILQSEDEQLQKLNSIVLQSIEEEKLLTHKLKEFEDASPSFSSRLADRVAAFGGSWKFILVFFLVLLTWIGVNIAGLVHPFDPYPFILLNLLLSTIAALQAPVIMMSQNRKEAKDRQRAINDYLVNLKAEVEIRNMQQKLDLLMAEQMKTLFDIQKDQMNMMDEIKQVIRDATPASVNIRNPAPTEGTGNSNIIP